MWPYTLFSTSVALGDLNGQDGWSKNVGLMEIRDSVTYQGTKSIEVTVGPNKNNDYNRSFTPVTKEDLYLVFRKDTVNTLHTSFVLRQGGETKSAIVFPGLIEGNGIFLEGQNGHMNPIVTNLSANTWYPVHVQFDVAGHPNQVRARAYVNGAWSSWTAWLASFLNFSAIDSIRLNFGGEGSTSGKVYIGAITGTDPTEASPPPPPPPPPPDPEPSGQSIDTAELKAYFQNIVDALEEGLNPFV